MKSKRFTKIIIYIVLLLFVVGLSGVAYKIYSNNMHLWLPDYTFNSTARGESDEIIDIIFLVVDHWEPGKSIEIVSTWTKGFRELADKHIDSDGEKLKHTWYYPIDYFVGEIIDSLVVLGAEGYGDVEVHWHHGDDNAETFTEKLRAGLDSFQAHGALISPDSQMHFSFIHGNWALDNSRSDYGDKMCGVNNEIQILIDHGCYGDFTFPALEQSSQPSLVNKIFYAIDNPNQPKSYDEGIISRKGLQTTDDMLMLFTGPLMINWSDWRFKTHPTIDDGNLYKEYLADIERFELWMEADIHVLDGPNWVFIRPFCHGASISDGGIEANLGPEIDQMLTEIEKKYRDNEKYRLHYMTAREAYNCVKAAEAGLEGNPNDYRDYILKPYIYKTP